jgi:hypothetical protein
MNAQRAGWIQKTRLFNSPGASRLAPGEPPSPSSNRSSGCQATCFEPAAVFTKCSCYRSPNVPQSTVAQAPIDRNDTEGEGVGRFKSRRQSGNSPGWRSVVSGRGFPPWWAT